MTSKVVAAVHCAVVAAGVALVVSSAGVVAASVMAHGANSTGEGHRAVADRTTTGRADWASAIRPKW